jgi:hypothetical protein
MISSTDLFHPSSAPHFKTFQVFPTELPAGKCEYGNEASKSLTTSNLMIKYENNQQDALCRLIYHSKSALQISGEVFAHHQVHLNVLTVSSSLHPSSCRLVSHQPAATWVNTTRYYKYNQVLLMMGGNMARNL